MLWIQSLRSCLWTGEKSSLVLVCRYFNEQVRKIHSFLLPRRKCPLATSGLKGHLRAANQSFLWLTPRARVGFSKSCSERVIKGNCIRGMYYCWETRNILQLKLNINLKPGYGKKRLMLADTLYGPNDHCTHMWAFHNVGSVHLYNDFVYCKIIISTFLELL